MNKRVAMPGTSEKSVLRSRVKSVLHLLTGNLGNALVMIGSIAFATRALGPERTRPDIGRRARVRKGCAF